MMETVQVLSRRGSAAGVCLLDLPERGFTISRVIPPGFNVVDRVQGKGIFEFSRVHAFSPFVSLVGYLHPDFLPPASIPIDLSICTRLKFRIL